MNRNGPFVTMTVDGRFRFGVAPAPNMILPAEAMSAVDIAGRIQPVIRTIPKPLPRTIQAPPIGCCGITLTNYGV